MPCPNCNSPLYAVMKTSREDWVVQCTNCGWVTFSCPTAGEALRCWYNGQVPDERVIVDGVS